MRYQGLHDNQGRLRKFDAWALYLLTAVREDGKLSVKIGVSSTPYQRYASMLVAIPFPSSLKFTWVGSKKKAFLLENRLHKLFDKHCTHGEWFAFQQEHIPLLMEAVVREFGQVATPAHYIPHHLGDFAVDSVIKRKPEWKTITEEQAVAYLAMDRKTPPMKRRAA